VEGIEHVGSTAVPGLAVKPVIDIMVGVKSLENSPILVERLVGIGYEYVPEFERILPFRRYLRSHLLFRDYLRADPEIAGEYAHLKYELSNRFGEDQEAYTDAKTHFISEVVRRAQENERSKLPRRAPSRAPVLFRFLSSTPTRLPTLRSTAEPYFLPKMGAYPDGLCHPSR
jgi:GrpB-like predicted nucleotidyltransferase (UPF0157 family)